MKHCWRLNKSEIYLPICLYFLSTNHFILYINVIKGNIKKQMQRVGQLSLTSIIYNQDLQYIINKIKFLKMLIIYKIMIALPSSPDVILTKEWLISFQGVNSPSIQCQQRQPLKI